MNQPCLFCRIVAREIPSETVYEDDRVLAFRDVDPKAPVHILLIPKRHVATMNEIGPEHAGDLAALFLAAPRIARDQGVADDGYRLVTNCQEGAGQSVFHLHVHLLGGRPMKWPPG